MSHWELESAVPGQEAALALVLRAATFAADKHRGLKRRDEFTAYINHPLAVAEILTSVGHITDPEILAAAILHDTIEDTDTSEEELRTTFGERVLSLVLECTDDKALPKPERKRLQVAHAPHISSDAKVIKIADKVTNMIDLVDRPPETRDMTRKVEYLSWSDEVFQGLKGVNPALDRLFKETLEACRQKLKCV